VSRLETKPFFWESKGEKGLQLKKSPTKSILFPMKYFALWAKEYRESINPIDDLIEV
jgi:hypothetical protein